MCGLSTSKREQTMPSYTASATTTGGRNGHVESSDGLLKFDLSVPKDIGGPGKPGTTNPEQLFAAGYSACFGGAVEHAGRLEKLAITGVTVTAEVTLNAGADGFFLAVHLKTKVDGVDHATAERLAKQAHEAICPYSKATRNNIDVKVTVI
jgi:Ohr subfamily peroxiredoxin